MPIREPFRCILPDLLDRLARASNDQQHSTSHTLGQVVRTEGQAAVADTAVKALLDVLPIDTAPGPASHPDGLQYEITFPGSDGQPHSIVRDDSDVADDLQSLIQLAMRRGALGNA